MPPRLFFGTLFAAIAVVVVVILSCLRGQVVALRRQPISWPVAAGVLIVIAAASGLYFWLGGWDTGIQATGTLSSHTPANK